MNTSKFNGERLKNARIFRGMSLSDLADSTGLTKQALSQYENGSIKPEPNRLFQLADSLDFPSEYFISEESFTVQSEATYFRSLMSTSKIERSAQSKRLEFVAQIYETLFDYIDFPPQNLPKIKFVGAQGDSPAEMEKQAKEIERIAQEVRAFWKLGNEPIKELKYLLESNGIVVTRIETKTEKLKTASQDSKTETVDAFSQRVIINDVGLYIIAIAPNQNFVRSRFDMAHELGHILLHPWSEDIESLSREEFKAREVQANMFANAFLLPRDAFTADIAYYPNNLEYYKHLKGKWNVSIQAMVYRAHSLGIITTTQYQYLWRQISQKGWKIKEPDDKKFDMKSTLLQGALELLFKENVLTPASFVTALKRKGIILKTSDVEDLMGLKRGTLKIVEAPSVLSFTIKPQDDE